MFSCSKDGKLVLSVVQDDNDKSLLRFVDVGPIYVSPDSEVGIDDATKFFPHDFDEMDGEIKIWLAQQSAREEEAAAADENYGEENIVGEEEQVLEEEDRPPTNITG